jgi:hypothetical protein
MSVDAQGNWSGSPCAYPWQSSFLATKGITGVFEYWEIIAVATDDGASIKNSINTYDCTIRERDFLIPGRLACSHSVVLLHGYYGSPHHELDPQPRDYCFGRELLANGTKHWVRVSDATDVKLETAENRDAKSGDYWISGRVLGTVSTAQASVFLLFRSARACFHPAKLPGPSAAKGASAPVCAERDSARNWRIREAVVNGAGDWVASIDSDKAQYDEEGPWVQFWQIQAIMTLERQAILDNVNPFGQLAFEDPTQIAHVVCSEVRLVHFSKVFSGYWRAFEPVGLLGACR